jgi:hypothetical protein
VRLSWEPSHERKGLRERPDRPREDAPVSTTASDDRRDAEEALWRALEQRAAGIRAAPDVGFSEPQHNKWREAHLQGRLIDKMCRAMEKRAGRVELNETNLRAMSETLDHDLEIWEQTLVRPNAPWRPYVTHRARQGAEKSIAAARAWAEVRKDMKRDKRDPVRPLPGGGFETKRSKH